MMSGFAETYRTCVDAADKAGLVFLLIGGHAVNARGYQRTTIDIDFLVPAEDLESWKSMLSDFGFAAVHETEAFAQFDAANQEALRIDLMLVDRSTFAKLLAGSEAFDYGGRSVRVVGVLHLIALKLHACRTWERAVQGKDYFDILNLVRLNRIDPASTEFLAILDRYATPSIRERLLRDLRESF